MELIIKKCKLNQIFIILTTLNNLNLDKCTSIRFLGVILYSNDQFNDNLVDIIN